MPGIASTAGDLIGLGAQGEHPVNAQAIKPTRLRCVSVTALHSSATTDPVLAYKLYEVISGELAAMRDLMVITGQRSTIERVAGFLMAFCERNARNQQDPADFALPMTRSDIGDFLGLTLETVSRTFSRLKALGLIELPQSNRVRVIDMNALADLAKAEAPAL